MLKQNLIILLTTIAITTAFAADPSNSSGDQVATPEPDTRTTAGLHMQVMLDRVMFSPGAIDGMAGDNALRALKAFQKANDLDDTGELDEKTSKALVAAAEIDSFLTQYKIRPEDAEAEFIKEVPSEMQDQSKLEALSYTDLKELLAERFHTNVETLEHLNPEAKWEAGETIIVPNVRPTWIRPDKQTLDAKEDDKEENQYGKLSEDELEKAKEDEIVTSSGLTKKQLPGNDLEITVTKSDSALNLRDKDGNLIFHAPVTTGSEKDPLPLGEWKVNGTERYPKFNYNPELFWDADDSEDKAKIPHGPNNPVGVAWIDLSKEHYGLHGTPDPLKIGYTASHGCVRLTNWDVLRLADMVGPGTKVLFLEEPGDTPEKSEDSE